MVFCAISALLSIKIWAKSNPIIGLASTALLAPSTAPSFAAWVNSSLRVDSAAALSESNLKYSCL